MDDSRRARRDAEDRAMLKGEYRKVTVISWLYTILLSAIPIVNVTMWIIWSIVSRRPSRKTYAIAMLILTGIGVVLITVCIAAFGENILSWAQQNYPEAFAPM